MKKNKIAALLLTAMAITTSVGCGTQSSSSIDDIQSGDKITVQTAAKKYGIEDEQITDGINLVNEYDCAWIHKEINDSTIDDETLETIEAVTKLNAYSFVDISNQTDITYSDEGINNTADFKECFGFDYKDVSDCWDLFYNLYSADNVDIDFEDAKLNIDVYFDTEWKYFVLNNTSAITKSIMKNVDYDEITDAYVHYEIGTYDNNGELINYVDGIEINIDYNKDNKHHIYTVSYGIAPMPKQGMENLITAFKEGGDMGDCGCSSDSGCNTGTNDPCEPECDMPDKIE